jgi:hypothetical protein
VEQAELKRCTCRFERNARGLSVQELNDEYAKNKLISGFVVCHDGKPTVIVLDRDRSGAKNAGDPAGIIMCTHVHEDHHVAQIKYACPTETCQGKPEKPCYVWKWSCEDGSAGIPECWAHGAGIACLARVAKKLAKAKDWVNYKKALAEILVNEGGMALYGCDEPYTKYVPGNDYSDLKADLKKLDDEITGRK